ncbi:hypothetical protein H5410_013795 [Solanum commersonii]|uniref:Retrotransposon gag domain-containing protein n=1 Tax=Solanum commersonii TaxID=4109 RepID=A0A9J5ZPD4_SOLCO|nr:hypothetical protein H5410_013795 [Solanum commersonii]
MPQVVEERFGKTDFMGETNNSSMMPSSSPNLAHQLPVKLTSSNYLLWKTQFMPMIFACGLNHHIDGTTQLVLSWIVVSVSENILPQLVGATTSRAAWDKLVTAYAFRSRPYIRELKSQLHTLRRDNVSIESYVQKAKGITVKLAALQHPVPNDDLVEFVLAGLGPSYRPFTRSLESRHEEITFDALYRLLLNEERQLKRDEAFTVIAPTTQYTQSSFSTTCGRVRGRPKRPRSWAFLQSHLPTVSKSWVS